MNVIIDTSIWSLALRRSTEKGNSKQKILLAELIKLIDNSEAILINPVRQELLTGLKLKEQFGKLKELLRGFPEVPILREDFESAAELSNLARSKGIQTSPIDSLLWAICKRTKFPLFTSDTDFQRMNKVSPLKLWQTS